MASISSLPIEILEFVVDVMHESRDVQSLASLARTCSAFYEIIIPRLYSKEILNPRRYSPSAQQPHHDRLIFWAVHFGRRKTVERVLVAVDLGVPAVFCMPLPNFLRTDYSPKQAYHKFFQRGDDRSERQFMEDDYSVTYWSPLHQAVVNGDLEMVKLLVEAGAPIDANSVNACSCVDKSLHYDGDDAWLGHWARRPLHTAICYGQIEIAKWLLEHGAPVQTCEGSTALHEAAERGHLELISFIVDNGYHANIHELGQIKMSPIWCAYLNDQWEALDLLIALGDDIDDDIGCGYTMLIDACVFGSFSRASYLVDRGANVNVKCRAFPYGLNLSQLRRISKDTCVRPIDICCWRESDESKPWRQSLGRDLSGTKHQHLQRKDKSDRARLVSKLLAAGAHTDACRKSADILPPLVAAAAEHLSGVVEALIQGGAPVDLPDWCGVTPLAAAFAYPHGSCLLHRKRPETSRCRELGTRWSKSVHQHVNLGSYSAFLATNRIVVSDPSVQDLPGDGLDSVVPGHGDSGMGNAENEHADDHNVGTENSVSPSATSHDLKQRLDNPKCVELWKCIQVLVANGADVNRADINGNTPFMRLCTSAPYRKYLGMEHDTKKISWEIRHSDKPRMASLLLAHGADPGAKITPTNIYGEDDIDRHRWGNLRDDGQPTTALQHAFWDGNIELCKLLCAEREVDRDTMFWMFGYTWKKLGETPRGLTIDPVLLSETYDFLKGLPVSVEDSAAKRAAFLAIEIRRRHSRPMALQIPEERVTLSDLQTQVPGKAWAFFSQEYIELGVICLHEAVQAGANWIIQWILELGVEPKLPSLLSDAVRNRADATVALLTRHGAEFNVKDYVMTGKELDDERIEGIIYLEDDNAEPTSEHDNPLRLAIKLEYKNCIRAMLGNYTGHIDPWFRCHYLKQACARLKPLMISCLLEHASMQIDAADLPVAPDDPIMDLPLPYLIRNVEDLCAVVYISVTRIRQINIANRLGQVYTWIACLAVFGRAGVDIQLKDKTGKSGLDYLGDHLVYMGKDRFKAHLAKELRIASKLDEVVTPEDKNRKDELALACYAALSTPEIYNPDEFI